MKLEAARRLLNQDRSLVENISRLGIGAGDVVYTATDLTRLPLPKPDRETLRAVRGPKRRALWLEWVYLSIREVIGHEGTIVAPTFSYDYARASTPFICEQSPGEVCNFSEYLRTKEGAVRSLHPLFSLSAVGPKAHEICDNAGKSAYGERSAFSKLRGAGTIFLFLGAPLGESLTYAHHLEQLYGVNHYFNKIFDAPVYKGGAMIPGPWLAFVRYLECDIEIYIHRFEQHLRDKGLLRVHKTAKGEMQAVACYVVHEQGLDCLAANPWFFIEKPVYIRFQQDNLKIFDHEAPTRLIGFVDKP